MPLQRRGRLKPKPVDEQYILRLGTELMSRYQSQDAQIDRLRQVRTLTMPVALDNRYQLVAVEVRPLAEDQDRAAAASGEAGAPPIEEDSKPRLRLNDASEARGRVKRA